VRLTSVLWSVLVGVGLTIAVLALVVVQHRRSDAASASLPPRAIPVAKSSGERPSVDRASKVSLGAFRLRGGKQIEVFSAETTDGRSCVLDESDDGATGGTCLDGDPFVGRRLVFSVSSEGRPDALTELRLSGAAAPTVHSLTVVRGDGSTVDVGLSPEHAFVFESTPEELRSGVVPASIRLYGARGRLLDTVTIPRIG